MGVAVAFGTGVWTAQTLGGLSSGVVATLESRFARADIGDARAFEGIIALGGTPQRLREAGRLARLHPHLRVVVTGAGDADDISGLLGPGIDAARVTVEPNARNTHENAVLSVAVIGPRPGERWLLVTSASHMPRAVGAFRKRGLGVEPWPIYDRDADRRPAGAVASHEVLGLAWYWALGRSSELFPAPAETPARPVARGVAALGR